MLKPSTLTVIIKNKDKVLFSGQVFAITSVNDKGVFDILAQHENFISLIKEKVIIHTTPKEGKQIQIDNGILRTYKDQVFIYVNFAS